MNRFIKNHLFSMSIANKNTFESQAVVHRYITEDHLQKPEQTILTNIQNELKNMKMLDIGVGGGRTTIHFAKLVKEYIGVDYSEHMVEACKRRFSKEGNILFGVADARALKAFQDHSFDFVLFSCNGLDYVNHDDRIKALKEIKRVLKKGGIFVFSTHNLNCLNKLYSIKYSHNPVKLTWRILRLFIILLLNGTPKKLKKQKWSIINDGDHRFRLTTYYITPFFQIQQLKELGFKDIHPYSLDNGKEINALYLRDTNDYWIYYVCRS